MILILFLTILLLFSLDTTNNNPNSSTYFDTIAHGFNGCNPTNGYVTLTFENSNFAIGNQNIDSLVFSWPDTSYTILTDSSLSNFLNGGSVSNVFNIGPVNLSFTVAYI